MKSNQGRIAKLCEDAEKKLFSRLQYKRQVESISTHTYEDAITPSDVSY